MNEINHSSETVLLNVNIILCVTTIHASENNEVVLVINNEFKAP